MFLNLVREVAREQEQMKEGTQLEGAFVSF